MSHSVQGYSVSLTLSLWHVRRLIQRQGRHQAASEPRPEAEDFDRSVSFRALLPAKPYVHNCAQELCSTSGDQRRRSGWMSAFQAPLVHSATTSTGPMFHYAGTLTGLIVARSYVPRTYDEPQDAKGKNDLEEARDCECRRIVVRLGREFAWVFRALTALSLSSGHGPLPDGDRWLFDR